MQECPESFCCLHCRVICEFLTANHALKIDFCETKQHACLSFPPPAIQQPMCHTQFFKIVKSQNALSIENPQAFCGESLNVSKIPQVLKSHVPLHDLLKNQCALQNAEGHSWSAVMSTVFQRNGTGSTARCMAPAHCR